MIILKEMKKLTYLFLSLSLFLIAACQDENEVTTVTPEPEIVSIALNSSVPVNTQQQITLTLAKPTPCHVVSEVLTSSSGMEVNYDIILESNTQACAQVIDEEVLTLNFNPQTSGTYTLNFLINGKLYETRQVVVTD